MPFNYVIGAVVTCAGLLVVVCNKRLAREAVERRLKALGAAWAEPLLRVGGVVFGLIWVLMGVKILTGWEL